MKTSAQKISKLSKCLWKNKRGQGLIESLLSIPLLFVLFTSSLYFIYEQLWLQTTEHILHEVIVCESTLNENFCISKANLLANRFNLLGKIVVHKTGHRYIAEIFLGKTRKWKRIEVNSLPNQQANKGLP